MEDESKIPVSKKRYPILFCVFVITLSIFVYLLGRSYGLGKYLGFASKFITAPISQITNNQGKINLLVLGKSGAGHDGADLTDTIMFVSVSSDQNKVDIFSLPRDIWIPAIRAKLNSAYYWGNQRKDTNGLKFAKEITEGVTGQPLAYGVVIDFSGFTEVVDVIGGIEVNVDNSFTDNLYPIVGKENDLCDGDIKFKCRYETVTFEKGLQKMNGTVALKFVRSRNAEGDEGTDIARAGRQQKVLAAIKNKMLTPSVLLSPIKIYNSWKVAEKYIETDINFDTLPILGRYLFNSRNDIREHNIPKEMLVNPPISSRYDYQYVFIPKVEGWIELKDWITGLLNK
jgi:LCP family protein required for cell wall assembly